MRAQVGPQGLGLLALAAVVLATACGDDDAPPDEGKAGSGNVGGEVTWCEVSEVLQAKCQRCHDSPPANGAPFPLVTYEDTQVEEAGITRWERMQDMVDRRLMPPPGIELEPPAEMPTAAERELLLAWFDEGADDVGGTACD